MSEMRILQAMNEVEDVFLQDIYPGEEKHRSSQGRFLKFVLLVAIFSLLGLTVFASEHILPTDYWFTSYFTDEPQMEKVQNLTDNQQQILERGMVSINQSVTVDGWTITVESGISDGFRMLLKYRIEAPEGVILDTDTCFAEYSTDMDIPAGEEGNYAAGYYSGIKLEDLNPEDNCVSKLMEYVLQPPAGSDFSIADGTLWSIRFHAIKEEVESPVSNFMHTLCQGNWTFQITFSDDMIVTESVEMLGKPIRCSATRQFRDEKFRIKVNVTSFELRTLTATVRFQKPLTGFWEGVMLDPIYVVMNDGTTVEAHFKMGLNRGDYEECIMTFDRPVSATDVAYIDFPYAGEVPVFSD